MRDFLILYARNVFNCATCNVRAIGAISPIQVVFSFSLQLVAGIALRVSAYAVACLVAAYVLTLMWNVIKSPIILSVFAPVSLGLTLVFPLMATIDNMLGTSVFVMLIVYFPVKFRRIDQRVVAQDRPSMAPDSLFGESSLRYPAGAALNAIKSMKDMDPRTMRLMRNAAAEECGPIIGTYLDAPIFEWIRTADGYVYDFQRTIPRGSQCSLPTSDLMLIPPGLVYEKRIESI
jgi:hypothetical protein